MSSNTASPGVRVRPTRQHRNRGQRRRPTPPPRPIELELDRIELLWLNRLEHVGGLALA